MDWVRRCCLQPLTLCDDQCTYDSTTEFTLEPVIPMEDIPSDEKSIISLSGSDLSELAMYSMEEEDMIFVDDSLDIPVPESKTQSVAQMDSGFVFCDTYY